MRRKGQSHVGSCYGGRPKARATSTHRLPEGARENKKECSDHRWEKAAFSPHITDELTEGESEEH